MGEVPFEATIVDVIEEPVPGVVVVTEFESVSTAVPISQSGGSERGSGTGTKE